MDYLQQLFQTSAGEEVASLVQQTNDQMMIGWSIQLLRSLFILVALAPWVALVARSIIRRRAAK